MVQWFKDAIMRRDRLGVGVGAVNTARGGGLGRDLSWQGVCGG
jgi:hypothetical protein